MSRGNCTFILKSVGFLGFWSAVVAKRSGLMAVFLIPLFSDFSSIFSSLWRSQESSLSQSVKYSSAARWTESPTPSTATSHNQQQQRSSRMVPSFLQVTTRALECRLGTIPCHLGSHHHHQWKSMTEQCSPSKEQAQPLPGLLWCCNRPFATQENYSR